MVLARGFLARGLSLAPDAGETAATGEDVERDAADGAGAAGGDAVGGVDAVGSGDVVGGVDAVGSGDVVGGVDAVGSGDVVGGDAAVADAVVVGVAGSDSGLVVTLGRQALAEVDSLLRVSVATCQSGMETSLRKPVRFGRRSISEAMTAGSILIC